jgi:UDP-glucose:(heptosyl)LPS alpha-1,3-glucosyltransferase
MKIALVIQNADRRAGGAESYTLDLARMLGAGPGGRGHQVSVIAEAGPTAVADGARAAGYQCVFLGAAGRTRWARLQDFLGRLKDFYEGGTYEIVHSMLPVLRCDVYQPHSGLATDSWLNGHLKHPRPLVQRWARRFNRFNRKRRGLARVEQELMRHRPWVLCFSSMMRDFAREQFSLPLDHLVTLVNGIDLSRFEPSVGVRSREAIREEWKIERDQRLALLVGNNWKLKGVQDAIGALHKLGDPRVVLMVVGRDDAIAYRKQAERLGVTDRVIFTGSVADPRPLYGAADFLLLPSRRDTCSLVVLEALAMGLPVITTRQNGASEVIEDGRQGLLLERGNPAALASAIRIMLEESRRREMAREAIALRSTLSIEHHVSRIEVLYQRIISERGDSAREKRGKSPILDSV